MKVQFKFSEKASGADRKRVLDRVQERQAQVEQLFPGEHDPELSSIFIADLPEEFMDTILPMLEQSPAVEFAEPELERKLISPTGRKRRAPRRSHSRSSE